LVIIHPVEYAVITHPKPAAFSSFKLHALWKGTRVFRKGVYSFYDPPLVGRLDPGELLLGAAADPDSIDH
jgi:hypothetical protein